MKKILMTIAVLALTTVGGIGGYALSKNVGDKACRDFAATTLIQSFGWAVKENQEVNAFQLSEEMFHDNYYHITNGNFAEPAAGPTSGNIDGISPEILDRDFFLSNDQNVQMYEFPIVYDMPEGTALQGIIAFYEDKICMSCIHIQLDASIISKVEANEEADSKITPLTWPLNVDKNTIEQWKKTFFTLDIPSND